MRQTPQQIRTSGYAVLSIGILNLLVFAVLATTRHNGLLFVFALASAVIIAVMGIFYITQAEALAVSSFNKSQTISKKVREDAERRGVAIHSLRPAGSALAATGAGLFVLYFLLALVTHSWSYLLIALAPAIILFSMGMLYLATDRPTAQ